MITPSIFEQTGWKGSTGAEICQDFERLKKVTHYDYNFYDKGFMAECEDRGIMHRVLDDQFCANYTLTLKDWLACDHPAVDKDLNGVPYKVVYVFSKAEIQDFWQLVLAARGALQDCWEIFTFRR